MDEAIVTFNLKTILKRLRKIRQDTWGQSNLCTLPIDEEIEKLEELVNDMDTNWNGSHPVGQS
jgi:hypothetical protein